MTRIDDTFARLKAEGKKAFVAYVMAGDPDEATSLEIVRALDSPEEVVGVWRGVGADVFAEVGEGLLGFFPTAFGDEFRVLDGAQVEQIVALAAIMARQNGIVAISR